MFAPDVLPDSECSSIAKSCFRYWTRPLRLLSRFSDIQRARMGKPLAQRLQSYDFDHQAQDVHQLKAWGLKQVTIGAVVGLSRSQVYRILAQSL